MLFFNFLTKGNNEFRFSKIDCTLKFPISGFGRLNGSVPFFQYTHFLNWNYGNLFQKLLKFILKMQSIRSLFIIHKPRSNCDYLTPNQAHLKSEKLNKRWKNYNRNFNYEKTVV